MSQNMSEMLKAWKKSCEKEDTGWTDKSRFYDMRKRPTGRPRDTNWSMTPEGEALYCEKMGLGDKNAEPMERKLKEDI
tara:strand:+ start:72 stop:305 length:234 start_codon:yes stop_codon:yes gene_type:complete